MIRCIFQLSYKGNNLHISLPLLPAEKLVEREGKERRGKPSKEIQKSVQKAREIQIKRFKSTKLKSNAEMSTCDVKNYCPLSPECRTMMMSATASVNLTARSSFKVIKISRTITDLDGNKQISADHLAEALQYRPKDD